MKIILLCLVLGLSGLAFSQSTAQQCAFSDIHGKRLRSDLRYAGSLRDTEKLLSTYLASHQSARTQATVYTLPVVFHVITNGGQPGDPDNPTDAQIQSTLALLNNAWRKNGPTFGGADMQIEFALAKRSANCGATSGINRVNGNNVSDYATNGMTTAGSDNESAIKALSKWSSADYINIWIVTKIDGSSTFPGGFAYFPEHGDSQIDGITILASTVDGVNKTIVHEMGHVFGLYHTFRVTDFDETSCPPTSDNTTGDMVQDTERTRNLACGEASLDCPVSQIADVVHNYTVTNNFMSYSTCQWMFTEGQKSRARAIMELFRPGLLSNQALQPPAAGPAAFPAMSATHGFSLYYGVERVKFNTLDIYSGTSVQDNANYVNRSCNQRTVVSPGSTHTITVTGTYANPQHIRVYIDYNNNGQFDEINEKVLSADWVGSATGSVTIPPAVPTNTPLLMRVIADDEFPLPPTAVLLNGRGQAEDFTLVVSGALPVSLQYFRAEPIADGKVSLDWSTTGEENSAYFLLQRGTTPTSMSEIGRVDAAGNSVETRLYQFIDSKPLPGINYYRLVSTDFDGSQHPGRIVAVKAKADEVLYPNPTADNQIFLKTAPGTSVSLYNLKGEKISCQFQQDQEGLTQIVPAQELTSGTYIVRLKTGSDVRSVTLVVR